MLISKDQVKIGPYRACRCIFQHRNAEGQIAVIVRIYVLANGYPYQLNGFMLPDQRDIIEPLVNGLAANITTNP